MSGLNQNKTNMDTMCKMWAFVSNRAARIH